MTGAPGSRGRVVVVDENEASRVFVCAALESASYEAVPVATIIGLRKALEPARPSTVLCEVSPPQSVTHVVASVQAYHHVANGRAPLVLCGSQSPDQLAALVRACNAIGYVERREDPIVLLKQLQQLVGKPRRSLPPQRLQEINEPRRAPQWAIIKLLLVDDSEIALEMMQERLRRSGFDVRIALSFGEVHSIIQGWSPNVIVADVHMPDIRGDDLCARLKTATATRDALIVLCSNMDEERLAAVADSAGADGFVSKNLGLDHFVSNIEAMCRRISNPLVSFR